MGKINKLAVYTMVLVYLINNEESYVDAVKKRLNSAKEVILSCMGMGEILAGFALKNDKNGKLKFLAFIETYRKLSVVGFGKQEALIFAELRAKYPSLKPPDAIHLATAISAKADVFLSNDKKLMGITELPVLIL